MGVRANLCHGEQEKIQLSANKSVGGLLSSISFPLLVTI